MDEAIETFLLARGALGIAPSKRFSSVQDFEAHVVQSGEGQTVRKAEAHAAAGVTECKRIGALS